MYSSRVVFYAISPYASILQFVGEGGGRVTARDAGDGNEKQYASYVY